MTNSALLDQLINDSGLKYKYIAEKLGITYYSLRKKINNDTSFTQTEIMRLRKILNIDNDGLSDAVFFNE